MRIACGSTTRRMRWPGARARAVGRLGLALGDGLDAAPDDLGDVARGVDDEGAQQARRTPAACVMPPVSTPLRRASGAVTSTGPPRATNPTAATTTNAAAAAERRRCAGCAGAVEHAPGATGPRRTAATTADERARRRRASPRPSVRAHGTATARTDSTSSPSTVVGVLEPRAAGGTPPRRRSTMSTSNGTLRSELDVGLRRLRDEPVARQAGDADQRAEHRGGDDADDRHPDGVAEADDDARPARSGSAGSRCRRSGSCAGWSR